MFAALLLVVPLAVVPIVWRPWEGCDPADRDSWAFAYEMHGTDSDRPKNVRVVSEDGVHTLADEEARTPRLSPDGKRLLYTIFRSKWEDDPYEQVVVSNFDGSDARDLVPGGGAAWGKWSPDGEQIAFWDSATESLKIAAADGSDGEDTTVVAAVPGHPDIEWSPDGTRLAWGHYNTIAWMELDTGHITEAEYSQLNYGPIVAEFAWQPDGAAFLFLHDAVDDHVLEPTGIYRLNIEGDVQEQVYEGTATDLFLLPDDTLGVVTGEGEDLISIDLENGDQETILDTIGDSASVAACA